MFGHPLHRLILIFSGCIGLLIPSNTLAQSSGQWGICEFETEVALNNYDPGSDPWACKIAFVSGTGSHFSWDGNSWEKIAITTIYTGDGNLSSDREITLGSYDLQLITGGSQSALTLKRDNNNNLAGISFRNSGNAYPASIFLSSSSAGNNNGLDFATVGNENSIETLGISLRLTNSGQLILPQYGDQSFSDEPAYNLGVNEDGEVIETNTATSSRIFYPPAINLDASATGEDFTLDLHDQYESLFGSPAVASTHAPAAIPTYEQDELYYYITDYDNTVLDNISIDENGLMTYDIVAVPSGSCTILNIVFVVKS